MTTPNRAGPRWTGGKLLFDVADGDRTFPCTISVGALQELTGERRYKPADLLASFARVRTRIEAIALGKVRAHPAGATGLVHLWSDDIDAALPNLPAAGDDAGHTARTERHGEGSAEEQPGSQEAESGQEAGAGHRLGV